MSLTDPLEPPCGPESSGVGNPGACFDWAWWVDLPAPDIALIARSGISKVRMTASGSTIPLDGKGREPCEPASIGAAFVDGFPENLSPRDLALQIHDVLPSGSLLVLRFSRLAPGRWQGSRPEGKNGQSHSRRVATVRRVLRGVGGYQVIARIYAHPRGESWITSSEPQRLLLSTLLDSASSAEPSTCLRASWGF